MQFWEQMEGCQAVPEVEQCRGGRRACLCPCRQQSPATRLVLLLCVLWVPSCLPAGLDIPGSQDSQQQPDCLLSVPRYTDRLGQVRLPCWQHA